MRQITTDKEFLAWLEGYLEGHNKPDIDKIKQKLESVRYNQYIPSYPSTYPSETFPNIPYYTVTS